MPLVSECIINFLRAQRVTHPGQDLLDRYLEHGVALETQVNVAAGNGEPVAGKRATWTNGTDEWWNLRIPKGAMNDPVFNDYRLSWPLELHAEGIGSTGWHWRDRVSLWVAFDFDSLLSHAKGVGISKADLLEVRRKASELPYVETRTSTGGKGLHLYVYLDQIPTANHTEHAALARCILGMMSTEAGYDFARQIDCCGSIMWVWHRKMTPENQGLSLLKPATKVLTLADLPENWKDHVDVVSRKRSKVRLDGIDTDSQDPFDQLTSARPTISLDATHKATIDELARSGFSTVWIPDYHLCQTHTVALKGLMEDPQVCAEFGLKGVFDTTSSGRDRATPNCFMFPLMNGAWKVYRFGLGVSEHSTWEQDGEGWTTCYFNRCPNLASAAKSVGGAELDNGKGFQFKSAQKAVEVARMLGQEIGLSDEFLHRQAELRANKDGRLVMRIEAAKNDAKPDSSWATLKGWMQKVFEVRTEQERDDFDVEEYDNRCRALVTPQGDTAGWAIMSEKGVWHRQPSSNCKMVLQRFGLSKTDAECAMGGAVYKPWEIVNVPFEDEYLGDRKWNLNAPKFIFKPAEIDLRETYHPHWDRILGHCFADLDEEVKQDPWMQANNIRNGAQYGLMWVACCFRAPFEPLPFLFFFGNQNCGKSIFHEALSLLVTGGVVDASKPLTTKGDFNGELAGGVLAVIEEIDIAQSPYAYNRMKDWVTARKLWIRKMRTDAYPVDNTLHFVMMANSQDKCPVFPGDTRITVIEVQDLVEDIPKPVLLRALQDEAPHFMRTLMGIDLPQMKGRLRLPVVTTLKKRQSEEMHRSALDVFLRDQCCEVPGEKVLFTELYERFIQSLDPAERHEWGKMRVARELPSNFPYGTSTGNKRCVGNLSFDRPPEQKNDNQPYISVSGRLKLKGD